MQMTVASQRSDAHQDAVHKVALSQNGQYLASSSADGTVKLWSIQEGRVLLTLEHNSHWIENLDFSADGALLVLRAQRQGGSGEIAKLWSTTDGALLHTWEAKEGCCSTFSPNGELLASSNRYGIQLWRIMDGTLQCTLAVGNREEAEALHSTLREKIKQLEKCQEEKQTENAKIVEDELEQIYIAIERAEAQCTRTNHYLTFSPDGAQLADGGIQTGNPPTIYLWSVSDRTLQRTLVGHSDSVNNIVYSSDGMRLISGSEKETILWSLTDGIPLNTWPEKGNNITVRSMHFSPDGMRLAFVRNASEIELCSASDGRILHTLKHNNTVLCTAFSPNGQWLASCGRDACVKLWSVETGKCLAKFQNFIGAVYSVVWHTSAAGEFVLTGSEDQAVRMWKVHPEGSRFRVTLCWTSTPSNALTARGVSIEAEHGLTPMLNSLLIQENESEKNIAIQKLA